MTEKAAQGIGGRKILHATSVAVSGRGLLITGSSGAGKSALALQLIALGALLISDDQTELTVTTAGLMARCPSPAIEGLIEARGIGLLRAPSAETAVLALVVDMGQDETERLPPCRSVTILGQALPLVLRARHDHFPAALMVYLQGGRQH
ncbi:HPr kinase/phosphatase C-terminal domain-containing protein [Xinfangfangia sp. CPCC 101601]|uniref:HPr kinase/phosphatase C-terminal domain-containing protein n=1 Tax=Pseudogemmobacter lacusdianii TaxID=3069608 RepID=A0ABU0VXC5_9RHOB|nr:HPr kinase/phosphatase C-terminal domain-containing protein [Xinfangfangia sp. CPCC 101601]MDQ2066411.1 HPr kinase/phosphatase C-terminal domain-containing protein [Xinfangfangia sp. CPCC 101601]